jgi:hypothetical protein
MALKRKIDRTAFDALATAELQSLYTEKDGNYILQLDDGDDDGSAELRRALDRERQEKRDAKKAQKEAEDKLAATADVDARKRGDVETLEKSWREKNEKQKAEYEAKLAQKDGFIKTTLVDSVAAQLAADLCGDKASIILPHIKARLTADLDGDAPSTKILDGDGKLSALTVADLKKEFVDNTAFSAIIVGSKASGSGASKGNQQQGNGSAASNANGTPDLLSGSAKQRALYFTQNKAT